MSDLALPAGHRDAVQQSGVRAVILWEGTNDVATRPGLDLGTVAAAYTRLIDAAHASGLTIIGATLQPHEGAGFYSHAGNRLREAVNEWIRWSWPATTGCGDRWRDPRRSPAVTNGAGGDRD